MCRCAPWRLGGTGATHRCETADDHGLDRLVVCRDLVFNVTESMSTSSGVASMVDSTSSVSDLSSDKHTTILNQAKCFKIFNASYNVLEALCYCDCSNTISVIKVISVILAELSFLLFNKSR